MDEYQLHGSLAIDNRFRSAAAAALTLKLSSLQETSAIDNRFRSAAAARDGSHSKTQLPTRSISDRQLT